MIKGFLVLAILCISLYVRLVPEEPEQCRMTYMLPSYTLIDSHARYSMWSYREADGRIPNVIILLKNKGVGIPILFVPGNAGSYKQARSLASELHRRGKSILNFHYDVYTCKYECLY
jgi:hypothetical protein